MVQAFAESNQAIMKTFIPGGLLIAAVFFLTAGCASHAPMSEMVMFHDGAKGIEKSDDLHYAHAFASIAYDHYDENEIVNRQIFSPEYEIDGIKSVPRITTHAVFMLPGGNHAFSIAGGNGLGADFTFRPLGTWMPGLFLTASGGTVLLNTGPTLELILQHRILNGRPAGWSFGASLNRNVIWLDDPDAGGCLSCHSAVATESAALRSVFTTSFGVGQESNRRIFMHLIMKYSYDFEMDLYYPGVSFSFGIM